MSKIERGMLQISFWGVIFLLAMLPDHLIPVHWMDRITAFIAGLFIIWEMFKLCYFLAKEWSKP